MHNKVNLLLAVILAGCAAAAAAAVEEASPAEVSPAEVSPAPAGGATVITADTLLFDYQQRMCVFEGNVVATDPRVRLESQKLHVFFDASNNVESVVATEAVKVTQEDRVATCGRAVYTAGNGAIVMTQNPVLVRGRDQLRGEEIRIFVYSEKVISSPARLVVYPADSGGVPGGAGKNELERK